MQTVTWKQAQTKTEIELIGAQKAFKTGSQNQPKSTKITENLSWQKTESTIVLAMLQSTGKSQVVVSHKRGMENAS